MQLPIVIIVVITQQFGSVISTEIPKLLFVNGTSCNMVGRLGIVSARMIKRKGDRFDLISNPTGDYRFTWLEGYDVSLSYFRGFDPSES
ncbi:unnamed protein product [Macrosiphum euphorbiae]|uniref:Uncharacterized protein n=1 Tax=Macrosiphum euphorbiae TaxID=13131 RepID=A0AAV0WRC4_9HEMI|nr:unnamed protein product [Macrosiphum euphorbiae]